MISIDKLSTIKSALFNSSFENIPLSIATTKEPDAFPDEMPGGLSSITIFLVV